MKEYRLIILDQPFETIEVAKNYVANVSANQEAGEKVARKILDNLKKLEFGAEGGQSADERFGRKIREDRKTYFTLVEDYVALYHLDGKNVVVSHLFSQRSDYISLIKKGL